MTSDGTKLGFDDPIGTLLASPLGLYEGPPDGTRFGLSDGVSDGA
jgi:hypothetical protein